MAKHISPSADELNNLAQGKAIYMKKLSIEDAKLKYPETDFADYGSAAFLFVAHDMDGKPIWMADTEESIIGRGMNEGRFLHPLN